MAIYGIFIWVREDLVNVSLHPILVLSIISQSLQPLNNLLLAAILGMGRDIGIDTVAVIEVVVGTEAYCVGCPGGKFCCQYPKVLKDRGLERKVGRLGTVTALRIETTPLWDNHTCLSKSAY